MLLIVRGKELPVGAAADGDGDGDLAHLVYKPPGCHPGDVIAEAAADAVVAAFKNSLLACHRLDLERCNGLFFCARRSLADRLQTPTSTATSSPSSPTPTSSTTLTHPSRGRGPVAAAPPPPPRPPPAAASRRLARPVRLAIRTSAARNSGAAANLLKRIIDLEPLGPASPRALALVDIYYEALDATGDAAARALPSASERKCPAHLFDKLSKSGGGFQRVETDTTLSKLWRALAPGGVEPHAAAIDPERVRLVDDDACVGGVVGGEVSRWRRLLDQCVKKWKKLKGECSKRIGAEMKRLEAEVAAGRLDDEQRRELTAAFAAKAYRECRELHLLAPHLERRRAEQQRGEELAVSSVYVQPPAELLVEAIAVYRAAYALAKQQQEEYDGEPTLFMGGRGRLPVGVVARAHGEQAGGRGAPPDPCGEPPRAGYLNLLLRKSEPPRLALRTSKRGGARHRPDQPQPQPQIVAGEPEADAEQLRPLAAVAAGDGGVELVVELASQRDQRDERRLPLARLERRAAQGGLGGDGGGAVRPPSRARGPSARRLAIEDERQQHAELPLALVLHAGDERAQRLEPLVGAPRAPVRRRRRQHREHRGGVAAGQRAAREPVRRPAAAGSAAAACSRRVAPAAAAAAPELEPRSAPPVHPRRLLGFTRRLSE